MERQAARPWLIVAGSFLGLIVGNGPVMQFTFGVFLKPLGAELHAERGTISAALLAGLVMTGVFTPIVGRLIDRRGARAIASPAILLFAVAMAAIGWFANSPTLLIVLYGIAGIAAAGQTPLPYSKAITSALDAHRGIALGIAMAGVGAGTVLMPMLAQALIQHVGWRGAYLGLGLITALLALPAMGWMVTRPRSASQAAMVASDAARPGLSATEAFRRRTFWILAIAFFAVAMAASGVVAHIVPLLTDRGVDPRSAAAAISTAGLALIVGRLAAGWMLDHVHAPYVAIVFFVLPLIGIGLLLGTSGAAVGIPAAVLVGAGLGAEVDLIAYLQSRYLGMKAFGEIYGYLFAVFMLGSGLGPFVMGSVFQARHSYEFALIGLASGIVVACVLMGTLGAYAYAKRPDPHVDDATSHPPVAPVAQS